MTRAALTHWFRERDSAYVRRRALNLLNRYGLSAAKAQARILEGMRVLGRYDCFPTFPTPGRVVANNGRFCREIQLRGAELAVHGYDHLDFRMLAPAEVQAQFAAANQAFREHGIVFEGFRCPYLSYTDQLAAWVPDDYRYGSNRAVFWDVVPARSLRASSAVFAVLQRFYNPASTRTTISMPSMQGSFVEIPASIPDDLQLHDGLKLGQAGLESAWMEVLCRTHQRGEAFVLLFHPESFSQCLPAFESLLQMCKSATPPVWVTQLREISRWWWEKAGFTVKAVADFHNTVVRFCCSSRATVLVRGVETDAPQEPWTAGYQLVRARELRLPPGQWPFVGIAGDVPAKTVKFLREQGYLLDTETPSRCALRLEGSAVASLSEVELISQLETSAAPLVRFWRWPHGFRSALCLSGDLDAMSLMDYASRLLPRK